MLERYRRMQEERAEGEEGGFTLIELLIVIVVLGILAAVTVFGLSNVTAQSAKSACHADAKTVEVAVEAYHTDTGNWPGALTDLTALPSRYLRNVPAANSHYQINLVANTGEVDVGVPTGQGTTYDVTPPTPNPCDSAQ